MFHRLSHATVDADVIPSKWYAKMAGYPRFVRYDDGGRDKRNIDIQENAK